MLLLIIMNWIVIDRYLLNINICYFFAVDFDHFQILRAIGKGSFGKVSSVIYNTYIL